jgi:hypothetical protein
VLSTTLLASISGAAAVQTFLKASNPDAGDHFGTAVAASGDLVAVSAIGESSNAIGINGDQSSNGAALAGAVYIFARNNGTWVQEAYLKAGNTGLSDQFGYSLAMSGDTLVVGAPLEDSIPDPKNVDPINNDANTDSGAAYVFVRINGVWTQQAMLKGGHELFGWIRSREFGSAVAIDGDTIVVGCPREQESTKGINPPHDPNTVGPYSVGAAYVFRRQGNQWTEVGYIKPPYASQDADLQFGDAVAVSGKNIFVSTVRDASTAQGINGSMTQVAGGVSGAVCTYRLESGSLTFDAFIKSSNSDPADGFGWSIAAYGETLVASAIQEDSDATGINGSQGNSAAKAGSGAVYVFDRSNTGWEQTAYIKAPQTALNDLFGRSVALKGNALAVGSNSQITGTEGSSKYAGAAFLYVRENGVWNYVSHYKPGKKGGSSSELFASNVALSGQVLVAGAPDDDNGGIGVNSSETSSRSNSGAAYIYSGILPNVIVPVILHMVQSTPNTLTIEFGAAAGLANFHFVGGNSLDAITQDLSSQVNVAETTPGNYRATLTLPAPQAGSYFIKLNP